MTLLTFEHNPATSCGYHRIALPFSRLKGLVPKVPVHVFNRVPQGGLAAIQERRRLGAKILMDLDDYWSLPEDHYLHRRYEQNRTSIVLHECLAFADVVMVTNKTLAERVRRVNTNVEIVPNALPFDEDQFKAPVAAREASFVYAAGPSHFGDIAPVKSALDARDVTLAGVDPGQPEWERICALVPRAKASPVRPVQDYMPVYAGHSIALAPLAPSLFNRCKSNLKVLEAGARNIPVIASRGSTYYNDLDRSFVVYADEAAEWKARMDDCRQDRPWVRELGRELGKHVRKHYQLADANKIRQQIIESFT